MFFTRGRHDNFDIYYISQSYFHLPKKCFFERFISDVILLFHDKAGLVMILEEWKSLCHKAWATDFEYLQLD